MRNCIAHALGACLRLFLAVVLPATGRHRRDPATPVPAPAAPATPAAGPAPTGPPYPRSPYASYNADPTPLTGEEVRLIRPYFLAHERAVQALVELEEYERVTSERRLAAALATLGVDLGPDVIHGVRVSA